MSTAITYSSPLETLHLQAEAELQLWDQIPIVQTFGQPQAEYAALRKSAAVVDCPQRGFIELSGKDRLKFLNNLVTNGLWDKAGKSDLPAGQCRYNFLLNLKGRVVADLLVLELGDRTLLETDRRFVPGLSDLLNRYLFGEQVRIISTQTLHELSIHGPMAAKIVGIELAAMTCAAITFQGVATIAYRRDMAGVPGYGLILPTEAVADVWRKVCIGSESSPRLARPAGWAAINAARIEAGTPILGIDFAVDSIASAFPGTKAESTGGALPAETGLFNQAVSVTKGCYLGQEIVARMHARNQVARQVCGLTIDGGALPIAGNPVTDIDGSPVGVITSSTVSPILSNAAIALAMVKRPHFTVGTRLRVPAEGSIRDATVTEVPFWKIG